MRFRIVNSGLRGRPQFVDPRSTLAHQLLELRKRGRSGAFRRNPGGSALPYVDVPPILSAPMSRPAPAMRGWSRIGRSAQSRAIGGARSLPRAASSRPSSSRGTSMARRSSKSKPKKMSAATKKKLAQYKKARGQLKAAQTRRAKAKASGASKLPRVSPVLRARVKALHVAAYSTGRAHKSAAKHGLLKVNTGRRGKRGMRRNPESMGGADSLTSFLKSMFPAAAVGVLGAVGVIAAGNKIADMFSKDKDGKPRPATEVNAYLTSIPLVAGVATVGLTALARSQPRLRQYAPVVAVAGAAATGILALQHVRVKNEAGVEVALGAKLGIPGFAAYVPRASLAAYVPRAATNALGTVLTPGLNPGISLRGMGAYVNRAATQALGSTAASTPRAAIAARQPHQVQGRTDRAMAAFKAKRA